MPKKIVIVEDERPMLKALTIKLQNEGFVVEDCSDAAQFFEKIKNESFDLILLDLMLPKISGFDVLESLRIQKNEIPIIVASNLSQKEDKERAEKLGAVEYVVKSENSLNDIVEKIKKFLN